MFTWGKHHFWLLPNLTEDCGFFESFKPFYSHKIMGVEEETAGTKRKKSKSSDKEEESGEEKDKNDEEENGKESEDDEGKKFICFI